MDLTQHLTGWNLQALEESDDVACVLDADLRIAWTNAAWSRFAAANGGQPAIDERWSAGARYTDAIPEPLKTWYRERFEECLDSGRSATHEYECSSPETRRLFRSMAYPVHGRALVLVHALVVAAPQPHRGPPPDFDAAAYADAEGTIRQCMHCRRVLHHGSTDRWDWVPRWVAHSPVTASHGLCPPCLEFYYPSGGGGRR